MYSILLFLHSWLRWVVVTLMLLTLVFSLFNWMANKDFSPSFDKLFKLFRTSLGIQLLVGFLLYFIFSPVTTHYLYQDFTAFVDRPQVIFTLLHPVGMFFAFMIIRAAEERAAKANRPGKKYQICFLSILTVAIILILAVPWSFYQGGRPLFRLPG